MARLTPAELQEAKKAAQAAREEEERAEAEHLEWIEMAVERHEQLDSVADGLDDEMDKIARRCPTMAVTERTVTRVNKLLAAVRELLKDEEDDFAEGLDDIVAAGDPPETRDVVVLLREVKDALQRFRLALTPATSSLRASWPVRVSRSQAPSDSHRARRKSTSSYRTSPTTSRSASTRFCFTRAGTMASAKCTGSCWMSSPTASPSIRPETGQAWIR